MDDIAHILWSIVIYYHYDWWVAALFGVLPDLLVFVPFYMAKILSGKVRRLEDLKPHSNIRYYEKWVQPMYNITHSLVFVLSVIGLCTLLFGYNVAYWAMLVHILVDIPSHERRWFGNMLFWPFSRWQFNGGSWATRNFMLANYTCLALAYGIRLFGL
jgi:hypothetical protein